ncbi:MAG: hypothetical protein JW882_10020 [Deltaproteobacteria bacterium]|nr:hypothetical protein [Deltaproteobacteria bacterium]
MEGLIIIGLIIFGIYLYKRSKKPKKIVVTPEISFSISTDSTDDFRKYDVGPIIQTEDNHFIINPKSTFPLTFYNISLKQANELKKILEENIYQGSYKVINMLRPFISKTNLKCKEINEYINKYKPLYLRRIDELISVSSEWASASEKDKEDLLISFKKEALNTLHVRPACDLNILFESKREDVYLDDALLAKYDYEDIRFYINHLTMKKQIFLIQADHYDRPSFDRLVALKLAIQGNDIPVQDILNILKLKEMVEIAENLNPPKFSRKAAAIEFLSGVSDIRDRLGVKVSFRSLFKLKPLPYEFSKLNLKEIQNMWKWEQEVISLIVGTYSSGLFSAIDKEQRKNLKLFNRNWEVTGLEDNMTCPYCKNLHGKVFSIDQCPSTPLHIGCRCYIRGNISNKQNSKTKPTDVFSIERKDASGRYIIPES